jgi:hypothetical protein
MQVNLAPKTGKATWQASATVGSIAGLFQNRANGEFLGAEINGLPNTIDLTYDAKNSAVSWNASADTGGVAAVAKLGPSTGTTRTHDASLELTGIPAQWNAGYGAGHPRFEGVSGPIGTIESTFTNHGSVTTGPGDHLSAVFDAGSGDLDASLRISALTLADFQPLANGFTGDLNMGSTSTLRTTAPAKWSSIPVRSQNDGSAPGDEPAVPTPTWGSCTCAIPRAVAVPRSRTVSSAPVSTRHQTRCRCPAQRASTSTHGRGVVCPCTRGGLAT